MAKDEVKFYKDHAKEWRWSRLDMGNQKEVGASSEGYKNYRDCYDNAYSQFTDTVEYDRPAFDETNDESVQLTIDD
jgi:uncharacterized protein YegP (UPF0339 family)